jgi:hypothetical protein
VQCKEKILKIVKFLYKILSAVVLLVVVVVLSIALFMVVQVIQNALFVPEDYIMWVFKAPYSMLVLVYELYIVYGLLYFFNKDSRATAIFLTNLKDGFIRRHKTPLLIAFGVFNIILAYTVLFNVTIITQDKIINYAFTSPTGHEYAYDDISEIETGVHGSRGIAHSKGDFYYKITLGNKMMVDLVDMGGSKKDEHPYFIIEKLDIEFVDAGIPKLSNSDNVELSTKILDKTYADKIKSILENKK